MIKKILIISISFSFLFASNPIHDLMDFRLKGKSFGGNKSDYIAAKDGLGIVTLQHYSGTRVINNELGIQKVLSKLEKKIVDNSLKDNLKDSIHNSSITNITEEKDKLEYYGLTFSYTPGSLGSCEDIHKDFPISTLSRYIITGGKEVFCKADGTEYLPYEGGATYPDKILAPNPYWRTTRYGMFLSSTAPCGETVYAMYPYSNTLYERCKYNDSFLNTDGKYYCSRTCKGTDLIGASFLDTIL